MVSTRNAEKKVDIEDDAELGKAVKYALGSGALSLFIVREDDSFISRRRGCLLGFFSDDDGDDDGSDDNSIASKSDGSDSDDDGSDGESDSSSGTESEVNLVDERKYKKFMLGQECRSIQSFKDAVNRYAVKKRRDIKYEKSDSVRVIAICSDKTCPWRIFASINSSSTRVVVRSLMDEHDCTWQGKVSLLTNARIAEMYIEEFRLNHDFSATQLQEKLLSRNINVYWTICERTRLRCLQTFDNEQAESFARLFDYVAELKRSSPGSTVECEVRETMFHRFYVCFEALKDGWKAACRKIIHVDGTFLKWRMTGMLLVACGRDPNDQMFPIAWAIVEVENKSNWQWFMEHLIEDLELGTCNGLTLASGQQKRLIAAVKDVLPFAEHRMCARHVHANWKKLHSGGALEDLFWAAANSYYPQRFERKMKELKEFDPAAYADLKIHVSHPWSRAFFTEFFKSDVVENNLGESCNAANRIARTKPVVEMLEEIRRRVMVGNEGKRVEAESARREWTPRSVALLDEQIALARNCRPLSCGLGKYEVGYFNDRFIVHLRNQVSCSCRMYLISRIPCCHIASALRLERGAAQDPKTLINIWFGIGQLRRCYLNGLKPINGMNLWEITTDVRVNPPPYKKLPGRPSGKKRKREKGEARPGKLPKRGVKMRCSICRQEGHRKNKCTSEAEPKQTNPPGRPHVKPIGPPPTDVSLSQPIEYQGNSFFSQIETGSASQPCEDLPTLSCALPRKKRRRPCKNPIETVSSSAEAPSPGPVYDSGPRHIPMEGYGVFTSSVTGDDYVSVGRSVTDTRDNTVLPSYLYKAREAKKLAIASGRGKI